MKYILAVFLLFIIIPLYAKSFTEVTKISGLTTNGAYVRVVLENMLEAEGCKDQNYYYLDMATEQGKIMLQFLLEAHINNKAVSIQIDGCKEIYDREYPIVNHVYICDTEFCN